MPWQNEPETLYYTYSDDVYRYLLSLCRNPSVAEDLLQATFLRVLSGVAGFRGDCTVKTWIFAIARHEFFRYSKKNPPAPPLDETVPAADDTEREVELRDRARQILDLISRMDEPHRSLMTLRLTGELSFREIGSILGKSEIWARVTFMRDKLKLLETLGGNDHG